MNTTELRELYVGFFAEHGHLLVPSSSLVPSGDPTVLLTTAGMQQFKPYFMGLAQPPSRRLVSVQKCFRTSDIDKVGLTARHCTFFEMLGNFSIGDYFKEEAIRLAWEFSVQHLALDMESLWISYFEGDDTIPADEEAVAVWSGLGLPKKRMVGLPRSDNFWGPVGSSGPCGPCSELYYDRGPDYGCGDSDCRPGCDCDRYVEFWNLVFTGYNMDEEGVLSELPAQNIDTGMGLERVAALKQDVDSVFLVDSFKPLIELGEELSGARFGADDRADVALRVLADHSRAMAFLVADGVTPSNEGRGYVLRRVIRRAARHSRSLGVAPPFLSTYADRVIQMLGSCYPELAERKDSILNVARAEEERFNRTLDQGLSLVEEELAAVEAQDGKTFPAETAFLLHDTYGFPVEVTREIAEEHGLSFDSDAFETAMENQRARARRAAKGPDVIGDAILQFARETKRGTEFLGYEREELYTVVENLAELPDGRIALVLRESPFYAEAGGQASDLGVVESEDAKVSVEDVQQHGDVQVVVGRTIEGKVEAGTRVKASLSLGHRHDLAANHTATHLLHYALRTKLGTDVTQAGSSVKAERLRFDFGFHEPLGADRLAEVEELVNRRIVENHPVRAFTTTQDHARDLGAMALFGEKYDEFVRVVEIDDFSRELCGGTHVGSTSELGILKILSEGSVGANVRRIEAITGRAAVTHFRSVDDTLQKARAALDTAGDCVEAIERLKSRLKELETEVAGARSTTLSDLAQELAKNASRKGGVSIVAEVVDDLGADDVMALVDRVRDQLEPAAIAIGADVGGKGMLIVSASKGLEVVHAGNVAKESAGKAGGRGGGNPSLGRAGGVDPKRLGEVVDVAGKMLMGQL